MKRLFLIIVAILSICAIASWAIFACNITGLFHTTMEYTDLEKRFGELKPYTPKVRFVHFQTKSGYQIDCLKFEDGRYQYLCKAKIK